MPINTQSEGSHGNKPTLIHGNRQHRPSGCSSKPSSHPSNSSVPVLSPPHILRGIVLELHRRKLAARVEGHHCLRAHEMTDGVSRHESLIFLFSLFEVVFWAQNNNILSNYLSFLHSDVLHFPVRGYVAWRCLTLFQFP